MKANNIRQLGLTLSTLSIAAIASCTSASAATLYNVLDLGTLLEDGSGFSRASGINDNGQVVGDSTNSFIFGVFRTAPNSAINPTTDDIVVGRGLSFFSRDINNLGQVVGEANATNSRFNFAFRTAPNGSISGFGGDRIGELFTGGSFIGATAINDLGQATGRGLAVDPTINQIVQAVRVDSSGNITTLGSLGSRESRGQGINNLGQVVGFSTLDTGEIRAFRTAPNSNINPATDDLGTLGGSSSTANDINDLGQVVGSSTTTGGETHAFRTAPNRAINPATDDLGTLGGDFSTANAINQLGQVVGSSELADGDIRAFLFDDDTMFDLNDLVVGDIDFTFTDAVGINERGQIAVNGFFNSDAQTSRAFLLTPVPEPTTMLGVLAFGAGASILRKKAKRN